VDAEVRHAPVKKLGTVLFNGEQLTVEFEDEDLPAEQTVGRLPLPEGGKPAGFADTLHKAAAALSDDAGIALKKMIGAVAQTAADALTSTNANEWSVELNVSFGGKVSPIPKIVMGESSASIKVCAKWKRGTST